MSRVTLCLAALAVGSLGVHAARADEPPAAPVSDEAWKARDLEGRWVLFRAAPDADAGAFESRWVKFLAQHEEWELLEWTALATTGSAAVDALESANRPTWMRTAVWTLQAGDSHKRGNAEVRLRAHAPLVRSWFARNPRAAWGRAQAFSKALATEGDSLDTQGAAALAPAHVPLVLLAGLTPPPDVEPFGERLRAEPGVTYVHQVERALAILAESGLQGQPWTSVHAALLTHPVREVRRAAALAAAKRPLERDLETALAARLEVADEHADVRSAALLALSNSPDPARRAQLLTIGANPRHPAFTAAVSRLADLDDGFALELWKDLDATPAGATAPAFLAGERKRLGERLAARDPDAAAESVARMLELAAHVDLLCSPLEDTLVPWTLATILRLANTRPVRAALDELAKDPAAPAKTSDKSLAESRAERVREYAREILSGTLSPVRKG